MMELMVAFPLFKTANIFDVKSRNVSFVFEQCDLQKILDIILEYPKMTNQYRTIGA